ncbi:MAG: HAD hydrolase family protein [Candidatus Lokiarchaeota archaeon]|nr:HAD hydrolase family protein [Candidatus Lokiarchaeota archaeon]
MTVKNVCCWDLEGPISTRDFAAELSRLLNKNPILELQDFDLGVFFKMLSEYDDYLIEIPGVKEELNIEDYQPGDTLRLIAPLYISCFSDKELVRLAEQNLGLLPGCTELMKILKKRWDIFIISTSYTHFAHSVAKFLKIPRDHVFCTELNLKKVKESFFNIKSDVDFLVKNIFQKFLTNDKKLSTVIENLNEFFWSKRKSDYIKAMNQVQVRGGIRKELAVEQISEKNNVPISEMIVLGDSITDINMLQRLKDESGIAVSFNGNRFTVKRANIAVTTVNNIGTLPIFEYKDSIERFLDSWEKNYNNFYANPRNIPEELVSREIKNYFVKYQFVPEIENLKNKSNREIDLIILKQENMRKKVRGWAGNLG